MSENSNSDFNEKVVEEILKQSFRNKGKTTIEPDALNLVMELGKLYVKEAFGRAAIRAELESEKEVKPAHFEKILPQLLPELQPDIVLQKDGILPSYSTFDECRCLDGVKCDAV